MRRVLVFLPLLIVAVLGGFFVWGLNGDRDPNAIPSALVSRLAPAFDLAPIDGIDTPGLSQADLIGQSDASVVNVFASWCVPCRAEHPVLTRFAREEGVALMGINYKDRAEDAAGWLRELGNPYDRIGHDFTGRTGIDWGVTGVPETFVIDAQGRITFRFAGPLVTEQAVGNLRDALITARGVEPGS
ncbi:MAG: DsbE family thiol:disulfide interchange protein [Marinovum sp.]|nr:DsbE family thiol:disulfide interchange protein [Marinovum sp.]